MAETSQKVDPRTSAPDPYAQFLAEVNQTKPVQSTEDIVNAKGVLLAKQGTQINHEVCQRLLKHRLQKPLEDQIQIKDSLDNDACYGLFHGLLDKYPDLMLIHRSLKFEQDFKDMMYLRPLHPTLSQKLTVLQLQMPDVFEKGLFCAWLSALMARELRLERTGMYSAYLAGLFHDVGFLHITRDILDKTGRLTADEWRAIQGHVVIGQTVLESLSGLPDDVPRAVLEHHERCDGTGYPAQKSDRDLTHLGQVVAMADSLQAIRMNQFERSGRNMRDALPYLQLNATVHTYENYRVMADILKKSNLGATAVATTVSDKVVQQMVERTLTLRYTTHLLETVMAQLARDENHRGHTVYRLITHVLGMIASSGMVREDHLQWLESQQGELAHATLLELNEIELMVNELVWQIGSARKILVSFRAGASCSDVCGQILEPLISEIDQCLDRLRG